MPTLTRELTINVRDPGRAGILRSFSSQTTDTGIGSLVRRDTERWGLRLVEPSDGPNFFADIDLTGATVEIGMGIADLAPTGGQFHLTYDGDDSYIFQLPATISASDLAAALNSNAAAASAIAVTVVQEGNSYIVQGVSNGARALYAVEDDTMLTPQSAVLISRIQTGSSTERDIQVITLAQADYAYTNTFTPYPAAGYTLTVQQSGDSAHTSIRTLTLTPPPYGSLWLLQGSALPWNASAAAVQAALGTGFAVTQPDADTPSYVISQTANGTAVNLSIDVSGLQVPKGAVMAINFNTAGMLAAFGATASPTITLLLQMRLTLPGQDPFTFLLINATVARDILSGALLPVALANYPPAANLVQVNPSTYALISPTSEEFYTANPPTASAYGGFSPIISSVGTGGDGSLEAVEATTARNVPFLRQFRDGGVLRTWILDAGTDTTSVDFDGKPNVQRPNDYSSSNQKVWSRWQ